MFFALLKVLFMHYYAKRISLLYPFIGGEGFLLERIIGYWGRIIAVQKFNFIVRDWFSIFFMKFSFE